MSYCQGVDGETLKSRLVGLLQKSRKAVRIYTSFDKSGDARSGYGRLSAFSNQNFSSRGTEILSAGAGRRPSPSSLSSPPAGAGGRTAGVLGNDTATQEKDAAGFTGLQLEQWQAINTELQRQLTIILDRPHTRLLGVGTVGIRDQFYGLWRSYETEARRTQIELVETAQRGDFVRAAVLAKATVVSKAREQATEAAHHELQVIVDRFRLSHTESSRLDRDLAGGNTKGGNNEGGELNESGCSEKAGLQNGTQDGTGPNAAGRSLAKVIPLRRRAV